MIISIPDINLRIISPALIVSITALGVLLLELVVPAARKRWLGYISLIGLAGAMIAAINLWSNGGSGYREMVIADNFGSFLTIVILLGAAISVLLSIDFVQARDVARGEYYVLLLASVAGMIVMVTATDLIVIFLGLELLSLPLYILAAFHRDQAKSLEAGMKYFLLGAFSSAFFLYGIALVYGAIGTTNLAALAKTFLIQNASNDLLLIGAGLLLVGFAFKIALVPFHWWTPDVYDGAPTTVTAFMSVAVKAAAFGALFRVFGTAMPAPFVDWRRMIVVLAILTMTLGNVAALLQSNIKRMLAYSSIAHAGYILIALVVAESNNAAIGNALFYLLAYTVTNLGAFGAVIALGQSTRERTTIADLAGIAREHSVVAASLAICFLSLAGFPPFAGFVAKFLIFGSAVESGYAWLAVVGVLNSLVSAYFYLRPIVQMYMSESSSEWSGVRIAPAVAIGLAICVVGIIALGVVPASAIAFASSAVIGK